MHYKVHFHVILLCIFFLHALTSSNALPCDSCGNECTNACGTKHFRTCCFNYLRKRKRNNDETNSLKFITNKRLIDFIMLQGHTMYTLNELSREQDEHEREQHQRRLKEATAAAALAAATAAAHRNDTLIDIGLQTTYFG